MAMPGRTYALPGSVDDTYRYSHNGQEKDNDIFIGALSAEYWEFDSRTGRRWENDPLTYPWQSPYATFNNNPVYFSDPAGLEGEGDGEGGQDDKKKGDGDKEGVKDKNKGDHQQSDKDKLAQQNVDEMNKNCPSCGYVYRDGKITQDKAGGTQSPDAKTNPNNNTGSNTPPVENKNKNLEATAGTAQNKENNSGGGLNNIINKVKTGFIDIANSPIAKQANKFAPTVTGILDQAEKFNERLNGSTRLNRQVAFSKGMRLPKVAVLISSKLGVTIGLPTKIVSSVANIVKPIARFAAPIGYIATGLQVVVNRKLTAGDVATFAATAAITALGTSVILPAALIWGGLELGSQIFSGKSLSDHINEATDKAKLSRKKGGVIFDW